MGVARSTDGYHFEREAEPIDEPSVVLARMQVAWLQPQSFEDFHGLVSNVTFVEGLVKLRGKWFA